MVLLFSGLWVAHPVGMGSGFIVIAPLLPSGCSFSFVLGCGVSFFGGFQSPPVDSCSTTSCDFGVLTEDKHTSFYSTNLSQSLPPQPNRLGTPSSFPAQHLTLTPLPSKNSQTRHNHHISQVPVPRSVCCFPPNASQTPSPLVSAIEVASSLGLSPFS